jgi:hypothetical protein
MWRRAYLFLLLVRIYFALSPSYLHPDENFQGPEVIAGEDHLRRNMPLANSVPKADYLAILQARAGNGPRLTLSEAHFHYGQPTAFR